MKKTIIVTPSFSFTSSIDSAKIKGFNIEAQSKKAVDILLNLWVETVFWPLYWMSRFQNAWTDQERAKELNDAYRRDDIHFIIPTQWWHNSIDLLQLIDYQNIERNWKPLLWLSDITVLLNAIFAKTRKNTYHWYDFLWQIGLNAKEKSIQILSNFFKYWRVQLAPESYNGKHKNIKSGEWNGIIIWWCLSSYSLLFWTEFDPGLLDMDFIFFIEDIAIHYERMEALLRSLKLQPYFSRCRGLVVGTTHFSSYLTIPHWNDRMMESIKEIFSDFDFPIVHIDDIGHITENRIIPIWQHCNLSVANESFSLIFPNHL